MGGLIGIGVVVAALLAVGVWRAVRPSFARPADGSNGLQPEAWVFLLTYSCMNLAALIHYTAQYPFFSHMKTRYLMSGLPVVLALVALALSSWGPKARVAAWAYLAVVGGLVSVHIVKIAVAA